MIGTNGLPVIFDDYGKRVFEAGEIIKAAEWFRFTINGLALEKGTIGIVLPDHSTWDIKVSFEWGINQTIEIDLPFYLVSKV